VASVEACLSRANPRNHIRNVTGPSGNVATTTRDGLAGGSLSDIDRVSAEIGNLTADLVTATAGIFRLVLASWSAKNGYRCFSADHTAHACDHRQNPPIG